MAYLTPHSLPEASFTNSLASVHLLGGAPHGDVVAAEEGRGLAAVLGREREEGELVALELALAVLLDARQVPGGGEVHADLVVGEAGADVHGVLGQSRDLLDRPSVTSVGVVLEAGLEAGLGQLADPLVALLDGVLAAGGPGDREPSRWLASEPPLKANPSTSLPFFVLDLLGRGDELVPGLRDLDLELLEPVRAVEDGAGAAAPRHGVDLAVDRLVAPAGSCGISAWSPAADDVGDAAPGRPGSARAATWSLPISVTSGPGAARGGGGELVVHLRPRDPLDLDLGAGLLLELAATSRRCTSGRRGCCRRAATRSELLPAYLGPAAARRWRPRWARRVLGAATGGQAQGQGGRGDRSGCDLRDPHRVLPSRVPA